jgi:hypothetical protein
MGEELRDDQWALIEPLLPAPKHRGRRRADDRRTLTGILLRLRSEPCMSRGCDMSRFRWPQLQQCTVGLAGQVGLEDSHGFPMGLTFRLFPSYQSLGGFVNAQAGTGNKFNRRFSLRLTRTCLLAPLSQGAGAALP